MHDSFDRFIRREGTSSLKWDGRREEFGRDDVIPLWVADMDFAAPPCVQEALRRRLAHGVYGYTVVPEGFAATVAAWMERRHGWQIDPRWVLPTPGVVFGLHAAVRAFSELGAAVVVQPPIYYPFYRAVTSAGRVVASNPLVLVRGRYEMDFADLAEKLASGARVILLCSPHNPGGRVWSRDELAELLALAERHDALVVSDEIHSDIVFAGSRHLPIGALPGAQRRVITVSSPTKSFNFPGIPIGYAVIADEALRTRFRREAERTGSPRPSVFAYDALQAAYGQGEGWLADLLAYLEGNRDLVQGFFAERIPEARPMLPQASYLSWIDFRPLGDSEAALAERLAHEARVGLSRGSSFGAEGSGFMRLNFACPRPLLREGLERIAAALKDRG